jgi:hypothetical protein
MIVMRMRAEACQNCMGLSNCRYAFKIRLGKRRVHQDVSLWGLQDAGICVENIRLVNGKIGAKLGEMRVHDPPAFQLLRQSGDQHFKGDVAGKAAGLHAFVNLK